MSDQIDITLEDNGSKGRYVARIAGFPEAEMTFSRVSPSRIIVDHTGVPDELRGKGVGQALVKNLVEDARARGFKVIPLCPFTKAQLERHPEWQDIVSR